MLILNYNKMLGFFSMDYKYINYTVNTDSFFMPEVISKITNSTIKKNEYLKDDSVTLLKFE